VLHPHLPSAATPTARPRISASRDPPLAEALDTSARATRQPRQGLSRRRCSSTRCGSHGRQAGVRRSSARSNSASTPCEWRRSRCTSVRGSAYLRALETALHGAGLPYGYAITVWSTGAVLIGAHRPPSLGRVYLFAAGAASAYGDCGSYRDHGGRGGDAADAQSPPHPRRGDPRHRDRARHRSRRAHRAD